MFFGLGRRAWAQLASAAPTFRALTKPVQVPLESVKAPWQTVPFKAEGVAPARGGAPSRRVLLSGVLFRRGDGDAPGALSALCVTCPHEQCEVELVDDQKRLAMLKGGVTAHPMFVCGCHASVFDAQADGAWIDGPAPRGLYVFRTRVADGRTVEIIEVEETALFEV
jgi:Rieske Fe-S protein